MTFLRQSWCVRQHASEASFFKPDYFAHAKLLGVDCGKLYGSKNKPLFLTTLFSSLKTTYFLICHQNEVSVLSKLNCPFFKRQNSSCCHERWLPNRAVQYLVHTCAELLYAFFRCKPIIYKLWWLHFFSFQVQLLIVLVKLATSA